MATNEQGEQRDRGGVSDHRQHRAPEGEGVNAPFAEELGHGENSIFDGAGNEMVVVTTTDEEGNLKQGTGPDRKSAMKDAKKSKTPGKGFMTDPHAK